MECLQEDRILQYEPDTLNAVRSQYGLDKPGLMAAAIDILDEWIQKQTHFTKKKFNRPYLERIIITSKGSVERAKTRLDKFFTLRSLMPHFFRTYNAKTDFVNIQGIICYAVLPKMMKEHERAYMCRVVGNKLSSKLFSTGYRFWTLINEYCRAHDYASAYHVILDYRDVAVAEMLAHADLQELREAIMISMEGYGVRVKGIHIIIDSVLIDAIVAIAKQVVSEKLGKRIHIHKSLDTLYDYVPKDVLPKDYGGEGKTLQEIHDEWLDIISTEEFQVYWQQMLEARTDETLRQKDKFNDQYLGMPGTFRSLSVD